MMTEYRQRRLCRTCRHWAKMPYQVPSLPDGPEVQAGQCRIRSPGDNGFPAVCETDWCSEWSAPLHDDA